MMKLEVLKSEVRKSEVGSKEVRSLFVFLLLFFLVFSRTDTFRVIWRLPAFTGGGRPHTHEYSHVWVEPPTHRRSAGRPPHMKVFAPTGTRTHAVRGRVVTNQRFRPLDHGRPLDAPVLIRMFA